MNPRHLRLLHDLLACPTAPFREVHVTGLVTDRLARARVPFFEDPVGNIVVGAADAKAYRRLLRERADEPVRLFVAHMDHPGFHGVRWLGPQRLEIKWHGGSPVRHLAGASMWIGSADGRIGSGVLRKVRLTASRRAIDRAELQLDARLPEGRAYRARDLYGGFEFRAPVWQSGKRIHAHAADDLVGVFSIVLTALSLFGRRRAEAVPPFIGLLTRAEEVGFVGAVGHLEQGWLQQRRRAVVCVSLEASRTLAGAEIGKGPVVRLGDRRTVFDPSGSKVLADLAERQLPGAHQRRIMDGGACEATAATVYGLPAIGLSVPLGNYHNEGFEGGPDCAHPRGPAPEFVHIDDVAGQVKLCRALMRSGLAWDDAWFPQRRRLQRNLERHRRLL